MQLMEHYVRLYTSLEQNQFHGELQDVTVPHIAACLYCTERNAKLLIKAMRQHGWIAWSPGRGRGNHSQLALLADPNELLLEQAVGLLRDGRIQETVELLNTEWLSEKGREQLHQALRQSFGYLRAIETEASYKHLLRFPSYRQPGMLDPALTTRRTELHFVRQLFDTLVEYDSERDLFMPGLAHHWETDRKAQCWRFYLQKHVRFHNETPCTADDVLHTLERLLDPSVKSPFRQLYRGIQEVNRIDDYSFDIKLSSGQWHLPALLGASAASIVPKDHSTGGPLFPTGTGPFRLSHRDERLLVLEANPFYFKRPANVDRIEMWYLPEIYEQQFNRSNEVGQEGGGMNFHHYRAFVQDDEPWELTVRTDRGCKYVLLNRAKKGDLEKQEIRNIVYKVIRECDAESLLGGNRGELANGFIRDLSEPAPAIAAKASEEQAQSDVSAASNARNPLLTGHSGASPSEPTLQLQLVTYAGAGHERDAAWLQQALGSYGIALTIRLVPYEALAEPDVLAQADLLLLEQPVDADAEWTMRAILGSGQSPLRCCLPAERLLELDRRLAELPNEPSREARLQQLVRLERELLDDQTVILWYRWHQTASFPPELRGVSISSLGWVDYKQLWFAHDGLDNFT
ncbi:ABC transporter substrate-binding protein [Paenibacillus radicis (ex Xue et al. 2023)]|uniref:ABC transporter substrate-binding protein n=1 Tax=Paenibacillus radicis (ex Xue et al. 2023) TaxID=2972489 RepID=A0ABT1YVE2_9BACL|nr:ABC transporter substrate-binding protein [Paenibacillus radicis (ex Xue et al. 2023)]MCR8636892.1 ABC transporter substrate-binding protein [Paenibacillus radicis (ex Xue et al. 2023)]